jgi:hypothetical protein
MALEVLEDFLVVKMAYKIQKDQNKEFGTYFIGEHLKKINEKWPYIKYYPQKRWFASQPKH